MAAGALGPIKGSDSGFDFETYAASAPRQSRDYAPMQTPDCARRRVRPGFGEPQGCGLCGQAPAPTGVSATVVGALSVRRRAFAAELAMLAATCEPVW